MLFSRADALRRIVQELGSSFHSPAKLVVDFLACRGSSRGLLVLGSCSLGVQLPLRPGTASWAVANPRGSSPGQLHSGGLCEN